MTTEPIELCSLCDHRPATAMNVFCWGASPNAPALVRSLCERCLDMAAPHVTVLRKKSVVPSGDELWRWN